MAKKPAAPKLSPDQIVAWGLLRKAMADTGHSRDKLPTTTLRALTKQFNEKTGESLTVEAYRDLAVGVDKRGIAKVEQALGECGLSAKPKPNTGGR